MSYYSALLELMPEIGIPRRGGGGGGGEEEEEEEEKRRRRRRRGGGGGEEEEEKEEGEVMLPCRTSSSAALKTTNLARQCDHLDVWLGPRSYHADYQVSIKGAMSSGPTNDLGI
ncbi:hypothetical protein E4U59_006214 [Claviceps monticola]|nr:hypothetical protein E4U59_006214 [Claviceps monticola]